MARKNNNNNNQGKTNKQIQKAISGAGHTVSYKEAASVANKLGVSIDRVYNQTAKTGQAAKAGSAAANAGYVPSNQLKVNNPISPSYITQSYNNYNRQPPPNPNGYVDGVTYQLNDAGDAIVGIVGAGGGYGGEGGGGDGFDWGAWQAQMMEQQAAVWASMDAMNAQFLQQQEEWLLAQKRKENPEFKILGGFGGMGNSADKATVKRKKKKRASTTAAGTKLSIGGADGNASGVSVGGAASDKTLGIG